MKLRPISVTEIWRDLLQLTLNTGAARVPRGLPILEVLQGRAVVDMNDPLIVLPERKLSLKFAFTEAWWMLTGRDDVATLHEVSKNIVAYSDDGVTFFGAYGKRYVAQRERILRALRRDHDTRQAVLTFWDVANPPDTRDLPCSLTIQWIIRDGALHAVYNMRSSDLWLGWAYDIFSFSCMSFHMLLELRQTDERLANLTLGNMYYTAGSMHLYDRDFEGAHRCVYDYNVKIEKQHRSMLLFDLEFLQPNGVHKEWATPDKFIQFLDDQRKLSNLELREIWA